MLHLQQSAACCAAWQYTSQEPVHAGCCSLIYTASWALPEGAICGAPRRGLPELGARRNLGGAFIIVGGVFIIVGGAARGAFTAAGGVLTIDTPASVADISAVPRQTARSMLKHAIRRTLTA